MRIRRGVRGAVLVAVAAAVLAGCGDPAADPSVRHTNRLHTESEARPGDWVRAPYDRFALLVEESGRTADPGGTGWRGVVRAYTPAARGEGTLGEVLWTDDTVYANKRDRPHYRWQEAGRQVWILTDRMSTDAADEVRVVEAGADGVWRSRTLAADQYPTVPGDVLTGLPAGLRERIGGGGGAGS
ncbi:hypothetical protein [Kitasatospora sp. NPDC048538]|uniref:hypothetical protein n=1 Tax=unclassified Kitasatospora TaxID=2633591 RepID=UPI0033C9F355